MTTVDYIGLWYKLEEQHGPVNAWDWLKGNGVYNLPPESLAPLRMLARQSIVDANVREDARRSRFVHWSLFWLVLALVVDLGVAGLLYPANSAQIVSLAGLMSVLGIMMFGSMLMMVLWQLPQIPRDLLTLNERHVKDALTAASVAYLGYELVKHLQK